MTYDSHCVDRLAALGMMTAIILAGISCENNEVYDPDHHRIMPEIDQYPSWSPNGSTIAFYHTGVVAIDYAAETYEIDPDSAGIWLIRPDGTEKRMLLRAATHPSWAPDSNWLAVIYGGADVWKIKADADSLTRLTFAGRNLFPSWSSQGDLIAYDSNLLSHGGYAIWLMESDGTDSRLLVSGRVANWHPNGRALIFLGRIPDVGLGIVHYDLVDSTRTLLFDAGETDILRYAKYSPDGEKIAFNWSNGYVWVMGFDGANPHQLTTGSGQDGMDWSPDGMQIVYATEMGLWISDSDGSEARQLTFPPD